MTALQNIIDQLLSLQICQEYRHRINRDTPIDELIRMLREPQGEEFCIAHSFPTLQQWRDLANEVDLIPYGVYVDQGNILIYDQDAIIIGDTHAKCRVSNSDTIYHLRAILGASAIAVANDFAIMHVVTDDRSVIETHQCDNSIILR